MENDEIIEIVMEWCELCGDFTTQEVHKGAEDGMIKSILCLHCNHSTIYET